MIENELKKLRSRSINSPESLDQIFESIPCGIFILNEQGQIIHSNKIGVEQSRIELKIGSFFSDHFQGNTQTFFKRFFSQDQSAYCDHQQFFDRDGLYNLFWKISIFKIVDESKIWIFTCIDVQDLKNNYESLLLQATRPESANRLAASIAHEIMNPLAILANLIDLLREDLTKDQLENLSNKGLTATNRISKIISMFTGDFINQNSDPYDIDLSRAINNIRIFRSSELEKNKVSLTTDIELSSFKSTISYRETFDILLILVDNCIDSFNPDSQKNRIHIISKSENNYLKMHIQDNGRGLSHLDSIKSFEPFSEVDESDRGIGIGLFIVDKKIKRANGSITIDSKIGSGTSVYLQIPINTQ